ncbi:uncharacterized protein B0H18DRAFT_1064026 [Fomitopsis serialis]|uniref:uncharacterized protein n=1 Tax=Fomitopsis serialis TaxID=139415 RepID=UPI00200777B9|nr:uncharacterized protein B0H18DRAFT_1064026 [Neoantrodia serialis]KAH9911242.1 hypothetical protein B0H18DRAFT_1064026 [Neoantrodia serialis]
MRMDKQVRASGYRAQSSTTHADRERVGQLPSTRTRPTDAGKASGRAGEPIGQVRRRRTIGRAPKRVDGRESGQAVSGEG